METPSPVSVSFTVRPSSLVHGCGVRLHRRNFGRPPRTLLPRAGHDEVVWWTVGEQRIFETHPPISTPGIIRTRGMLWPIIPAFETQILADRISSDSKTTGVCQILLGIRR